MIKNKSLMVGYKLFFGLLGFSAIVTEIAVLVERNRFNPANFFSYFTIEGNIIGVTALLFGALATARGKQGHKMAILRGAATVYLLIIGIGFAVLLSGLENAQFTAVPWDNIVLHYIMPLALLIDWLMDPPEMRLGFKQASYWLLFPVVYVAYSLTRGIYIDWYPYPFLDPNVKGYGYVAMIVGLLLMLGVAIVWCLSKFSKARR